MMEQAISRLVEANGVEARVRHLLRSAREIFSVASSYVRTFPQSRCSDKVQRIGESYTALKVIKANSPCTLAFLKSDRSPAINQISPSIDSTRHCVVLSLIHNFWVSLAPAGF